MVSPKTILLLSGAAGSARALAPSVVLDHRHSRGTSTRPNNAAGCHHSGRTTTTCLLGPMRGVRPRSSSRDSRLSYRRLHSTPTPVSTPTEGSGTIHNATSAPPPPLPLDFDRIRSMDVLESLAQRAETEIGADVAFDETPSSSSPSSPVVVDDESEPSDAVVDSKQRKRAKKKSETRRMVDEIAAIALPSLGGMLLDPIMSLIDTACVGQVSTTALAAMAPCTSIFQFSFFAFFFLSAATTNLVASNPPEAANDVEEAGRRVDFNQRVVSNAAVLAVALGSLVTAGLVKFSDPLLRLAGVPASNVALLNAARPYLLIRAMGLPFVFLATVLQGASLGRGDAWRPLRIFGAAGLINLAGDVWLTLFKGWGATGAATATVAAQIGAALYYVWSSARLDKGVEASSKPLRDVALAWRGLPSREVVRTFLNVAVALFSRSIGLMLGYSLLTRTAVLGGETALAAHQVTLQVWWLMSFLPEPMSVAAQTLITRDMKDRKERVPGLIRTLYKMSGALGLAAGALTGVVLRTPAIAGALVADVAVRETMARLVPLAMLSQSYCPLGTLSDGVCIGLGSFSHLPAIMLGSFLATAAGLSVVAERGLGVVGVWACMNVFLASRIAGHALLSGKLRRYVRKAFGKDRPEEEGAILAAAPVVA